MAGQEGNTLMDRVSEMLLEWVEEVAPSAEEREYRREAVRYVLELMQPSFEALQNGNYLDCVRYLDQNCLSVAEQGFGFLVDFIADRASENVAPGDEQADLVRGWAHRARGYVYLAGQDPGRARRRFRWALRYGFTAQDCTLQISAEISKRQW